MALILGCIWESSCEKHPIFTVSPISISPLSGFILPSKIFIKVDFPRPFLPIIPILSCLAKV